VRLEVKEVKGEIMDFKNQTTAAPGANRPNNRHVAPAPKSKFARNKIWRIIIVIIIVIIIAAGAYFFLGRHHGNEAKINKNEYQAVFLTNGQVYFGKLSHVDNSYLDLKDIYYLQTPQSVQQANNNQDAANKNQQTQLVKLGNELHGPEDDMQISNKQILFWENLKNDGKVAQAINSQQKK
jgi:flagellar basal body-associated protein FliL